MLNVRKCANEVLTTPIDLVREMVADGIEVLQVSKYAWRVEEDDWQKWKSGRAARTAQAVARAERKADSVATSIRERPKRRARFTR